MPYYVRLMRREDIAQVTEIDRQAFPGMWPPVNYRRELENRLAHYIVACDEDKKVAETEVTAVPETGFSGLASRVRRLFSHDRFFGNEVITVSREYVIGFAGFWVMADEAHIISIAVREDYLRQGIGELLLISVIDLAAELNASMVTLEVRASNIAAQGLYNKYGFAQVGRRAGYYTENREDAVLMTADNLTSDSFQACFQQLKQEHSKKWGAVRFQAVR